MAVKIVSKRPVRSRRTNVGQLERQFRVLSASKPTPQDVTLDGLTLLPVKVVQPITVKDYQCMSVGKKFKICLNYIRCNIFHDRQDLKRANVKNIFLYQLFGKFEKYYSKANGAIGFMDISTRDKVTVIEMVEKVYLNCWNLNEFTVLDRDLVRDL